MSETQPAWDEVLSLREANRQLRELVEYLERRADLTEQRKQCAAPKGRGERKWE